MKKAAASVKEVTVIATPACFIASEDNDGNDEDYERASRIVWFVIKKDV